MANPQSNWFVRSRLKTRQIVLLLQLYDQRSVLRAAQLAGMTQPAASKMLGELEVGCTRVAVTELRENTFYASISLRANGRELEIDSRPSDALALAVRSGAPIFAADEVIAESAIEFEHEVEDTEEVVEKFKDFLDRVTPEDFAGE